MRRAALLAVALMISGFVYAGETSANTSAAAQPCSDHEGGRPRCPISKSEKKKASKFYGQAMKLAKKQQLDAALDKLQAARELSPQDTVFIAAEKAFREKVAADSLHAGNKAMLTGQTSTAITQFRRAVELDPRNEYAQQRLSDALPNPEEFGSAKLRADLGTTQLTPAAGVHSFEFRGSSPQAIENFARMFGIFIAPDQGLTQRNVRIKLDDVSWEAGSEILQKVCKVLMIPMSEHQVLVVNDTEENRRDLTRMTLRTFYSLGGSTPQELSDLTTALRILFDLRFITQNAAQGSIVIRAPQQTMDAITSFLEYVQDEQPTVMLDIKVFQVSTTYSRDLGASIPTEFSVFNITSEINKLVSSSSYQQIVAALQASGQTVNTTTILAALLASSSSSSISSVLTQPFATFGGGLTLSGVTIPSTSAHFSNSRSTARTVEDVLLRAGQGKAATLKVGSRYPIVSSQFSATNATTSILSSLGIGVTTGTAATSVPSPQFSYEDLGLVLKATPHVHGKLVSMEYELTLRALGATQSNGLPLLTNREMKGTISTDEGESIVMAGLVEKSEIASINGIPLLSLIPGLGKAFSVETKEHDADELLVVVTPHLISRRSNTGSYIRIPTNVPK